MSTDKKYPNGTIYKIWSHINDCFYIGSTFRPLRCRKNQHKRKPHSEKMRLWFEDVGWDNLKFVEIATHKDITRRELTKLEDDEIRKYKNDDNCMNTVRAYQTKEERILQKRENGIKYREEKNNEIKEKKRIYRLDNLEKIKQRDKEYHKENKENRAEKGTQKIKCIYCDTEINRWCLYNHNNTTKHIKNFIEY